MADIFRLGRKQKELQAIEQQKAEAAEARRVDEEKAAAESRLRAAEDEKVRRISPFPPTCTISESIFCCCEKSYAHYALNTAARQSLTMQCCCYLPRAGALAGSGLPPASPGAPPRWVAAPRIFDRAPPRSRAWRAGLDWVADQVAGGNGLYHARPPPPPARAPPGPAPFRFTSAGTYSRVARWTCSGCPSPLSL